MNHNWEYKRLGDVCSFIGGGTPSKSNSSYYCGTIPWATVRDMTKFELSSTELSISEKAVAESATKILPKGMIIISTHVGLGKICLLMQDTAINQDLKGISFLFNEINKYFFSYWYRNIANYIISNGKGATVKGVTLDFMKSLPIPTPSMQIQEKIVSELDKINELIEIKRSQLKDLDALAQSLFYETFGDPIENPKGWKLSTIGDVASVQTGATPSRDIEEYFNGDIPWVKTTEVQNCDIFETDEHISPDALNNSNCKLFPINTIIVAMYGQGKTRGQIARLRIEACTNQACAAILPCSEIHPLFLYAFLRSSYEALRDIAVGCNQKNLNLSLVKNYTIFLPPLSLQEQFAARIEAIEAQKKLVEASIADLETLFASRMDYWFND